MKLLVATDGLPFGSGEPFLVPELEELERYGHRLTLMPMSFTGRVVHPAAKRYAEEAVVADPRYLPARGDVIQAVRWMRRVRRLRGHLPRRAISRGAVMAGIVRSRDIDHIHATWASEPAAAAAVASALTGKPWSFSAHRYDIFERPSPSSLLATASFGRFVSEDGLTAAQRLWSQLPEHNEVIHLGISVPEPAPWPRIPNVLYAARMIERKDHATLIRGFASVETKGDLLLAGDGPLRTQLEELAASTRAASRIRFLGQKPHTAMLRILDDSQVALAIQTSHSEGISVSLMEALGRAIPVVATDVGGTTELLRDLPECLISTTAPTQLATRVQSLLDDPGRMRALGRRGRDRVVQGFDVRKTGARLNALIESFS